MEIESVIEAFLEKFKEQHKLLSSCKTEEEYTTKYKTVLSRFRNDLEPYVYQYFMLNYGQKLDEHWKQHTFPKKSKCAWVIAERRCHPNWWFFLRNIAWSAPHFSLYIFCSDENLLFLQTLLGNKLSTVHLIPWFKGFASRDQAINDYNSALKSPHFYQMIDAEYAIVSQLDTYLRYKIPNSMLFGDYFGCPWGWKKNIPGGGGLSLRKISSMILICQESNSDETLNEDDWIGNKIIEYNLTYPPLEIRELIFSENYPVDNPIGVHQFWTFIHNFHPTQIEYFKKNITTYLTIHI
jgi:Protein of unknown function (DUF5672)